MTTMNQHFTHLHVHTEASLLDGLARLKEIFQAAAENGQSALAVTDHGTMGGIWKAKDAAKAAGVKLIPGVELYLAIDPDGSVGNRHAPKHMLTNGDLADDSDESGEGAQKRKNYYHLTLLATTRKGWQNLIRIQNAAERTKWSKYPMADLALLGEDAEGLVALSGCLGGPVLGPVAGGDIELGRKNLTALIETFGRDNVFLEVMEHGIRVETQALPRMWELSQEFGVPLVATNDSHFTHDCDAHAHDAWLALRTLSGKSNAEEGVRPLDDPKRYRFTGHGYHLRSTEEMYGLFTPDRAGSGSLVMSHNDIIALRTALEDPILPLMLKPGEATPELVAGAREWVDRGGQVEDDVLREFILRVSRETFYLNTFGRPKSTPSHPRNWWHEACANTQIIAERTEENVVPDGDPLLPVFPTPDGFLNNVAYLKHLINEGANRMFPGERPKEVSDRLNTEWKTIFDMGFIDYFLIVEDVVSWAKSTAPVRPGMPDKKPILVGPGRGSGAGSLVAGCLGITGLDPLRHDLLFERFIEYGRSDWPDFDIDFERNRREEILDYLEWKWGEGHVALIGSYGVSKSRRAVKDAARLLGQGKIGAQLTKVIPVVEGNPLGFDALLDVENAQTAEFRRVLDKGGAEALEVLELAQSFDAIINGASIHACGVIISDRYLPDLIPLRLKRTALEDGTERIRLVTQWDSKDCEKFGLLKLDILALRNLDIMHTAFDYIADQTGEVLTMETIPHASTKGDPRVDRAWQLLRDGRTAGIFQAEGAAMTQLIQDVQPENEEHLSAIYALFRPGPISAGMPEHYGLRKNGKESVDYGIYTSDPTEQEWIATRLGKTHGILAYQEQMMLLGTTIAGFDAGQRSSLRRAIGKKDKVKMAQVKDIFLAGAIKEFRDDTGEVISPVFRQDTADRIWAMFEGAASYAFNASHSMAYAYLGYYTAFLKANWPGAYGAAILANTTETDRRVEALLALPAEGIEVLAPDVNLSAAHSTPEGLDKVRIGLSEVGGVSGSGGYIVKAREQSGEFKSIADFVHRVRVDDQGIKKMPSNQLTGLIESGAMDAFGPRYGLVMVARLAEEILPAPVPSIEWGVIERSARQRQRLGVSLGQHPLVVFRDQVKQWSKVVETPYGIVEEKGIPIGKIPNDAGQYVTVIGLLAQFSEGSYKGGRKAAIVIEGSSERVDGIMWDRELTEQRDIGIPPIGWPVAVTAKVGIREFEQEDDEGNITIVKVRQLTVRRIDLVNIIDPVIGSLSDSVEVPDLSASAVLVVHEAPASKPAAASAPEPAPALAAPAPATEDPEPRYEHEFEPPPEDRYAPHEDIDFGGTPMIFDDVAPVQAPAPVEPAAAPKGVVDGIPLFELDSADINDVFDIIDANDPLWVPGGKVTPSRIAVGTRFTYSGSDGRVIAHYELV
jgi:DNA polymerase-3 subunit alpha